MTPRPLLPLIAAACLAAAPLRAAGKSGQGSGLFLRVPAGARAAGLGEAFAGAADDAQTLFWNPAGLAPLRNPHLQFDHLFFFDQTRVDGLAFAYPTRWGGVGLGTRWFTGPKLQKIRNGADAGEFSASERTLELAAAAGKRNFSFGLTGRYFEAAADGSSASALMADAGALKQWRKGRYRLGAAVQNMGSNFGFGSSEAAQAPPPRLWRAGFSARGAAWLVSLEHRKAQGLQGTHHAGAEVWAMPALALRAGYVHRPRRERNVRDSLADWRFGAGFRARTAQIDYAFTPAETAGELHRVSLSYRFSGLTVLEETGRVTMKADPPHFSPNGDGRQDSTFLLLGTEGLENITRWQMSVRSPQGARVWKKSGRGAPPGLTEWSGLDETGPLPDGDYALQARVWSSDYQALSAPARVTVDNAAPQLAVRASTAVVSPDGDGVDDAAAFDLEAKDRGGLSFWSLEIAPRERPAAPVYAATGAFTGSHAAFVWAGGTAQTSSGTIAGEPVPNGSYVARVTAQDAAGNRAADVELTVESSVDREAVLKNLPSTLKVETVPEGHRLSIPSERLFADARKAQISPESAPLRAQLVTLLKAFPEHEIFVNGHAGSEPSTGKRVQLSSAQAWALYSALVKAGIPATRLEVHGQGGDKGERNRLEIFLIRPEGAEPVPEQTPLENPSDKK